MKSFVKNSYRILLGFTAAIGLITVSCSDMNEKSDEFLDRGSTVYAPKVDSVAAHSGFKKIELEVFVKTQKINVVKISWNNGQNTAEIPVNNQQGVYTKVLEDIAEDGYVFYLTSIDSYGNESLPVEVYGTVYGDKLAAQIKNRNITLADKNGSTVIVTWASPVNYGLFSILSYINTEDSEDSIQVPMSETVTTIDNFKSTLRSRTFFLPAPTAIDTLSTSWKLQSVKSKVTQFVSVTASYTTGGCYLSALTDGIGGTNSSDRTPPRWANWPHVDMTDWIILEVADEVDISGFGVCFYNDSPGCVMPAWWTLEYWKDEDWSPFPLADTYGYAWDKFNTVHPSEQVLTSKLRLNVTSSTIGSVGILELEVLKNE
jgi:hypothetical protein